MSNQGFAFKTQAYISSGPPPFSPPVNWSILDKLTGTKANGELDAIWYFMLLGGDAGWDLAGQQLVSSAGPFGPEDNWIPGLDPELSYANIEFGYNGPSSFCLGNGSVTGIQSESQTLTQRLTIVQHNTRHVTASEVDDILATIRILRGAVRVASPEQDVRAELTAALREASKLLLRAKPQGPGSRSGPEGSVSATTPTHLLEWFIRRVTIHAQALGERQAQRLITGAYAVIAQLEGQGQ